MTYCKAMTIAAIFAATGSLFGEATETDDAVKRRIVDFVNLPASLCGRAAYDFREELRTRTLVNRQWFDGDTNRLVRLIAEIAHTNDARLASLMIDQLGRYGTSENVPFLCSCATNAAYGGKAVIAILRVEGVTSNSIDAAQAYLSLTNRCVRTDRDGSTVCAELVRCAKQDGVAASCRTNALAVAWAFATGNNRNYYWLDRSLVNDDPTYRYSKRRLSILRSSDLQGSSEFMTNYVAGAIAELVAYPESDLPD